jgi:hypothetical protein
MRPFSKVETRHGCLNHPSPSAKIKRKKFKKGKILLSFVENEIRSAILTFIFQYEAILVDSKQSNEY